MTFKPATVGRACLLRPATLAALTMLVGPLAHAQYYAFSQLDGLPGAVYAMPRGINASGEVVGTSYAPDGSTQAVIWNGGTPTMLDSLGGTVSQAMGINAAGQVVGLASSADDSTTQAVVWNGSTPTVLNSLGGPTSIAVGINSSGMIAGYSTATTTPQAVVWNGTALTALPLPAGSGGVTVSNINDAGQVIGTSTAADDSGTSAVIWNGTTPTVLTSLGGTANEADGINNAGQVVGASTDASGVQQAVLWNGTTPTVLNSLSGLGGAAYGINNLGQIVGESTNSGFGFGSAVLWNGSTTPIDLNTYLSPGDAAAGWQLIVALGINDSGTIVGIDQNTMLGTLGVFELTPTPAPEPQTYAWLLSGLALLGVARRRLSSQ